MKGAASSLMSLRYTAVGRTASQFENAQVPAELAAFPERMQLMRINSPSAFSRVMPFNSCAWASCCLVRARDRCLNSCLLQARYTTGSGL